LPGSFQKFYPQKLFTTEAAFWPVLLFFNHPAEFRRAKEAEAEKRKIAEAAQREELQRARIRLANAKAEHQELKNQALSREQTSKQFVPQKHAIAGDPPEVLLQNAA
jgi:hypothetical protein